jgi:ATP-binding cassette subfamily G (WHITE) protein 2 (SNQ2)
MFYTKSNRMFTENAEGREGPRVPLHNIDDTGEGERPHEPEEVISSASSTGDDADGTWGERDIGGPVNFRAAMHDYEEMRRELTNLSKTRTNKSNRSGVRRPSTALRRVTSAASRRSRATRATTEPDVDVEALGDEKPPSDDEDDFELGGFLKDGHFEKRDEGGSAKKVGVIYKHLTVKGVGATTTFVRTLPHAVIGVRLPNFLDE